MATRAYFLLWIGTIAAVIPLVALDAQGPETVRCSINYAPDRPCRMVDRITGDVHRMTFTGPGINVAFVAKSQSGWWAGKLNNVPAMGYERNRGNVVISSYDLTSNFAWWYSRDKHGTY